MDGIEWERRVQRALRAILEDPDELQRFLDDGLTVAEIASTCASTRDGVRRAYDKAGLPRPPED